MAPDGRVNVLLVDDQPEGLLALEAALAPLGENLVLARSGQDALRHLLRDEFAVVLLDVVMADLDGFETALMIRDRERSKGTPIIFLTALKSGELTQLRAYGLGAVDYLVKPFEPEILRSKVAVLVELAKKTELVRQQAELVQESQRSAHALALAEANRRVEAERSRAREEALEGAIRARDEFLSIASHELRTPLTSLKIQLRGMLRGLRKANEGLSVEDAVGRFTQLDRSVDRISNLVLNLLDLSSINAGKFTLILSEVDLCEIVREVAARFQPDLSSAACGITISAGEQVVGKWDRGRLDQLVTNLLTNAIKYAPGKPIEIAVTASPDVARLTIRDEGKGISPEHQARIFGPFERAVSGEEQGGVGLGLWIVARIVSALGGTISVDSAAGQGATFTVSLPREMAEARPPVTSG